MRVLDRPWGRMHVRVEGTGTPLLLLASLGTDLRLWDAFATRAVGFRLLRLDKPGHGLSDLDGAVSVESMADDAAALIEAEGASALVMGVSLGGLVAQVLALRHPRLVRALVLSNTAARVGTAESWGARIAAVEEQGLATVAGAILERWFAAPFRASPALAPWRNMLARTNPAGYVACCRALARADLTGAVPRLALPVLAVAGSEDGATPPDLVAATAALIPGARLATIPGAGHLPMAETPDAFAALVLPFLREHA